MQGPLLGQFLPATLITRLREDPEDMVKSFDGDFDSPELIWDQSMRSEFRNELDKHLDKCLSDRERIGPDHQFSLPPEARVRYKKLDDELYIGGVYVSRFLKEPTYNLRDPTTFLELLLQRWKNELERYCMDPQRQSMEVDSTMLTQACQDTLQLVTTASVFLCKVRESLCEKLSQWGYMPRSMYFMQQSLVNELLGTPLLSVVRILHVAANHIANVESIALSGGVDGKQGIVDLSIQAIGKSELHPDCAFMVEMLKKVYVGALGDIKATRKQAARSTENIPSVNTLSQNHLAAMAPSPAPGEGPVRKKVNVGDDPLGMFVPATNPAMSLGQGHPQRDSSAALFEHSQLPHQQSGYLQTRESFQREQSMVYPPSQPSVVAYSQQSVPQMSGAYDQLRSDYSYSHQHTGHSGMYSQRINNPQNTHEQDQGQSSGPYTRNDQQLSSGRTFQQPSYQQRSVETERQNQPQHQHAVFVSNQAYTKTAASQFTNPNSLRGIPPRQGTGDRDLFTHQHSHQHMTEGSNTQRADHHLHLPQIPTNQSAHSYQLPTNQGHPHAQPQGAPNQPSASVPLYRLPQVHFQNQGYVATQNQTPVQSGVQQYSQGQARSFLDLTQPQTQRNHPKTLQATSTLPIPATQSPFHPSFQGPRMVETVEGMQPPAPSTEGTEIDARSKPDPNVTAEQQAVSTDGAPGAAQGRVVLLQQALSFDLCEFLVDKVLENPTLQNVKDPSGAKVHSIELLKLLTKDPGYGAKFKLVLEKLPAWKKYKSQDHSLLITGHEQKTDYFLTDGGSGEPKKMLTEN